jgi:hypothetical protein
MACCASYARPNSNCEWPPGEGRAALSEDAEFAEDLAIRYADTHHGLRSGHWEGPETYASKREQCMETLFKTIASRRGVTEEQVRQSLGQRPAWFDLAVLLGYAVLYGWIANLIVGKISRGEPAMAIFAATAVSAAGVLACEEWSIVAETYRLGNGHLSYRTARLPWGQHRLALFIGGMAVYCVLTAARRLGRPLKQAISSPAR